MDRAFKTPTHIAELWKTVADFARALGVGDSTARAWLRRQRIPVGYWPQLIKAAAALNVTITNDDLVAAHVTETEESAA